MSKGFRHFRIDKLSSAAIMPDPAEEAAQELLLQLEREGYIGRMVSSHRRADGISATYISDNRLRLTISLQAGERF
jgi:hypothetical protein